MSDKYEEFKEWVFCNSKTNSVLQIILILFHRFEEEQAEKEKGKEIKDTIKQALEENNCCFAGRDTYSDAIYKKLEEKDLIK